MALEEGCRTLSAQLSIFAPKLEHSSPYGQILLKYLEIKINDRFLQRRCVPLHKQK